MQISHRLRTASIDQNNKSLRQNMQDAVTESIEATDP